MFNSLNMHTQIGFIVIYGLLLFAFTIVQVFQRKMKFSTHEELINRVKTWFIIITLLLVLLISPRFLSIMGFACISFFAFREYVKSITVRLADQKVVYFSYLVIPIQYLFILMNWYSMALVFIPVYVFLSMPIFLILSKETSGFLKSAGTIYWGMMATVFCLSHVVLLFTLPAISITTVTGYIFFLLFLTEFNDVLQYVWGKMIGRIKITPTISPNKTLGGFLGGVISTTLLAYFIAPYFTPFTSWQSLLIGFIIGFAGFIGDICLSAIKRDIGIKDYSSFLPGHGGLLDRLDSLIYTAPLFFHFLHYTHY